jgi:hypothetical protein
MRLAAHVAKARQFVGVVMLLLALPAIWVGVVEWHRESDERLLAVVYAAAGMYLAYEGVKLIRKGGSAAARKQ